MAHEEPGRDDVPVSDLPLARRAGRAVMDRLRDAHAAAAREHAALLGLVADLVEETAASLGVPVGGDPADAGRWGPVGGDPAEAVVTEIALALRVGTAGARRLVHDALALTTDLPQTHAALRAGTVGPAQTHAVVAGTAGLTPEQTRWVDTHLAADLTHLEPRGTTRRVRALVAQLEAGAARRRVRYETCHRHVRVHPLGDGVAELVAVGPVADITALFTRIDTWGRTATGPNAGADPHAAVAAGLDLVLVAADGAGVGATGSGDAGAGLPDRRGIDARRFDALVGLVTTPDTSPRGDGRAHAGPCTGPALHVALTSLVGLDDQPAVLTGHGPVPIDTARELLAAGHPYRRVLTDPFTGRVLGVDGHLHPLTPTDPAPGAPSTSARASTSAAPSTSTHLSTGAAPSDDPADGGRAVPPTAPPRREGGGRRQGTPAAPAAPATVTSPPPPGLTDKLTRIADAATPDAPGTPMPRGGSLTCPWAGRPTNYVPTAEQTRYLRAALPECTFPGCTVPATRCDLDHQVPHGQGGPTCECNLRPRCRRHHQCRTHHGWHVDRTTGDPDDPHGLGTTWTSPLGLVHHDPATPFLPRPVPGNDTDDGTRLPTGWDDHGDHPEPTYPTVDMAFPTRPPLTTMAATDHGRQHGPDEQRDEDASPRPSRRRSEPARSGADMPSVGHLEHRGAAAP